MQYKISIDGGAASNSFGFSDTQKFFLGRFSGQLKYLKNGKSYHWSVRGEVRPEIYMATNNTLNLQANFKGEYFRRARHINSLFFIHSKQQYLNLESNSAAISAGQIGGKILYPHKNAGLLSLSVSYYLRKFSTNSDDFTNAAAFLFQWQKALKGAFVVKAGGYIERFYIRSMLFTNDENAGNNGTRFGPEIGISYRRSYVLNANYRYLLHRSDITRSGSDEQHLRFLLGKLLGRKWSVFFLLDYYFRNYEFEPGPALTANLIYTPIDTENRIYVKLERELKRKTTLYLRIGYLNEDLTREAFNYSGWQGTAGIAFRR